MTQGFYTFRVWIVSGQHKGIVAALVFLSIIQLVTGFVVVATLVLIKPNDTADIAKGLPFVGESIAQSAAILCDGIISASLVYFLRRTHSIHHSTQFALRRLALYSVNVGIVTT